MTHRENSRAFSRRYGRCFWKRAQQFSSADKPTPEGLASAGITNVGSAEGHIHEATIQADGGTSDQGTGPKLTAQRNVGLAGAPHAASRQRDETAGAFIPMLAVGQYHYDRWATLAVIAVFCSVFAVAIIRANRFPKPLRRGGRDEEKPNEPQGMALAHESEASRINRGLTPDGHRAVKQPAGRVMPQQQFSSRPTTPPRGPFASRGDHRAKD